MNLESIQSILNEQNFEDAIPILENHSNISNNREEIINLLIECYNSYATNLLDEGDIQAALEILRKAESYIHVGSILRSKIFV